MKYALIAIILCCTMSLYADDWPREVVSTEGTITMYQPQIESYSGNSMRARAAVSIIPTGKEEPVFGAVWVTCSVLTDRPTRTVRVEEMEVRRIRFPKGTEGDTAKIAEALEEVMPRFDLTFSLDLLLESIETVQKEKENARELDVIPPKIIILNRPAVLVRIDGDPILTDVEGTSLKRVVNTPYFIVQDNSMNKFFLRGGGRWFSAKKIMGPWRNITAVPNAVANLSDQMKSDDDSYEDSTANAIVSNTGKIPEIVVSSEPAELIATDGPMQFVPVQGTGLLYVRNTSSRLFLEIGTQKRFILISGRWYTAPSITGPWEFIASDKLPEDFKNIPPGSACDDVLASVAGTLPAKDAVFDSQIPQMAEVDRTVTTDQVEYDGDPQFQPIENTGMEYAVNTPAAVIRVHDRYYNCDNGIWFDGYSPRGPWEVCVNVPEIIYTIPSRCPIYNVRYVRVYNYTHDVVTVGYTAGYTGCYVYGRTVVYGTGYYYRPWHKHNYYARPWTWGFNVHYNPWTGWSFGGGVEQTHGWFTQRERHDHAGWWGPTKYYPVYHLSSKPVYREGYHPVHREIAATAPTVRLPHQAGRISGVTRSATLYDNRSSGVRRPVVVGTSRTSSGVTRTAPTMPQQTNGRPITRPAAPPAIQPESRPATRTEIQRQPEVPPPTRPAPSPATQPEPRPGTRTEMPRQPEAPLIARPAAPPVVQPMPLPNPAPQTTRFITRPSTRENNIYAAPNGNIMRSTPQGWQQREQNTWKPASDLPAKEATIRDSQVRQRTAERLTIPTATHIAPAAPKPSTNDKEKERRR